jgi:O-antigen/teichoic acid export membrane protein
MTGKPLTHRFLLGSASSMLAVLVSMAALLVTGKLVAVSFSRELVGVLALMLVSADFLNVLFSFGLPVSMPRLVAAAEAAERPVITRNAVELLGWTTALSCLAALLLMAALGFLPDVSAGAITALVAEPHYIILLWLLAVSGTARDLLMSILAGLDLYAARAAAVAMTSLLQVGLVAGAVWLDRETITWLVLAMVLSYGIAVVWMGGKLQGSWRVCGHLRPARSTLDGMRALLRFSGPLYANQLLTFFYQRFDTVLVGALLGLAPAAVFELVKRLPMAMTRVLGAGLTPYLPHLTRFIAANDRPGAARLAERSARITACMGYGAALTVIVFREPVVRLLFSDEYLSGTGTLALLLAAAVISLQTGVMGQTLIAMGRTMAVTLINTGLVAVGLAMNAALIPMLGMAGAGWASVTAVAFSGVLQACWVRRHGVPVRWRAVLLPHAVFALACLPALFAEGVALRLSGMALFVTLGFALGVVTPGEIGHAAGALRPGNGKAMES